MRRQEGLPFFPNAASTPRRRTELKIEAEVPVEARYRDALPVHDLAVAAGTFSATQSPSEIGWVRVQAERELDRRMFVARVRGKSMEFASQFAENIVLIDGARLASLMIDHAVGVDHYRILRLPRVDEDYFDSE